MYTTIDVKQNSPALIVGAGESVCVCRLRSAVHGAELVGGEEDLALAVELALEGIELFGRNFVNGNSEELREDEAIGGHSEDELCVGEPIAQPVLRSRGDDLLAVDVLCDLVGIADFLAIHRLELSERIGVVVDGVSRDHQIMRADERAPFRRAEQCRVEARHTEARRNSNILHREIDPVIRMRMELHLATALSSNFGKESSDVRLGGIATCVGDDDCADASLVKLASHHGDALRESFLFESAVGQRDVDRARERRLELCNERDTIRNHRIKTFLKRVLYESLACRHPEADGGFRLVGEHAPDQAEMVPSSMSIESWLDGAPFECAEDLLALVLFCTTHRRIANVQDRVRKRLGDLAHHQRIDEEIGGEAVAAKVFTDFECGHWDPPF